MRDSFIDVSEMPDNDKPRYTKKDLWKVLEEKNELKLKVYELEEELEHLKRCAHACVCGSVTDQTRIKRVSCWLSYPGSNLLLTTYLHFCHCHTHYVKCGFHALIMYYL